MDLRSGLSVEDQEKYHVQIRSGLVDEAGKHVVTNDLENPYVEK
jgi:hypothetical protein